MFCDGLEKVLAETQKFYIVKKYNSGKSLLNDSLDPTINLLIIDIEMPGLSGFDVIKRLRLKNGNIKIVILSMHEEIVYSNEACAVGADAYLAKTLESTALIELLLRINHGERIFLKRPPTRENNSLLSERELEVLKLLAKGKTSNQIGQELNISPLTIKAHRRNMIKKFKVNNSIELISRVFEDGIL